MKKFLSEFRDSIFVRKLIKRILLMEVISLILTTVVSYAILWPRLSGNKISEAMNMNSEIVNRINDSLTDMSEASQYILNSSDVLGSLHDYDAEPSEQNYSRVCLALTAAQSTISSIRGVTLEANDGRLFYSVTNLTEQDFNVLDTQWYKNVRGEEYNRGYSEIYEVFGGELATYSTAYARNLYIRAENYTMTIFFNAYSLSKSVQNLSSDYFTGYLITNNIGIPFLTFGEIGNSTTLVDGQLAAHGAWERDKLGFYFFDTMDSSGWTVVGFVDMKTFNSAFMHSYFPSLLLCILLCVITVILILPVTLRLLRPVKQLSDTMSRVSKGERGLRACVNTDDEIGRLSNIFNDMIDNLNKHMEKHIEYEATQERMKYNLLIAQIDTHFIYNTMNVINILARQGRNDDIVAINSALAHIMQNYLRIKAFDVTDSVAQEMEVVDQYWIIQNMRYDNRAELIWDVSESVKEKSIPKNLIQPLVENSLLHGLLDEETGEIRGRITVEIYEKDGAIAIRVSDNGKGIPPNRLAILNASPDLETLGHLQDRGRHIGLANIRQRLTYIYKQPGCMRIESDEGTIVTLILTLAQGEGD